MTEQVNAGGQVGDPHPQRLVLEQCVAELATHHHASQSNPITRSLAAAI